MSPLSFVRLAGRPAGKACSNVSRSPPRAALNIRVANSIASGGIEEAAPPGWELAVSIMR